jgi:hypothetical protein
MENKLLKIQYDKQRYQKNKEKIKQRCHDNYHNNKDTINEKRRNKYINDNDYQNKAKKRAEEYRRNNKTYRIKSWKKQNIKCNDWNKLYDEYNNTKYCYCCNVKFIDNSLGKCCKCLDHHHLSGEIRNIICKSCNNSISKVDNNMLKVLLDIHRYHK